ncbi:hypothetical protein T08_2933 [Trichinella sp. T8]|nr:hypothetical protein T08_2933 [Trichinella sp. T8]
MVKFTIRNSNVQMFNTNATPGCCAVFKGLLIFMLNDIFEEAVEKKITPNQMIPSNFEPAAGKYRHLVVVYFFFHIFFQCSPVIYCSGEVFASSECWVQFFFTALCQMLATLAGAECGRRVVVCAGWNVTIVWSNFEYPASCITLLLLDGVFPGGRTDFFPSPLHDHRIWVTVRLSVEYSLGVN